MAIKSSENFEMITYKQEQVRLDGEKVKAFIAEMQEKGIINEATAMSMYKEISFVVVKTTRKDPKTKKQWEKPDLRNHTIEGLVEYLALTREEVKLLEKTEGFIKERLMAELAANGDIELSDPPPMEDWLKEKINGRE
jgi:hypothetical protein